MEANVNHITQSCRSYFANAVRVPAGIEGAGSRGLGEM